MARELDLVQGTLDLFVLSALAGGPAHGYSIMSWLRRASARQLRLEDAALYPALHRLAARGLVEAEWGLSENNRRAKYYRLTRAGRRALDTESGSWNQYVAMVSRILGAAGEPA